MRKTKSEAMEFKEWVCLCIDLLLDMFVVNVLGWCIPSISELPLEHSLLLLLAGEGPFLFSFVCVRVPRARHRGRARRHRGCQRALAGRGGGRKERGRDFRG